MGDMLIKSSNLRVISDATSHIVYHSLFGFPQILNDDALELLNNFSEATMVESIEKRKKYQEVNEQIKRMKEAKFLRPPNFDERQFLRNAIHQRYLSRVNNGEEIEYLSLIVTENCNFACQYCISNSMIQISSRRKNKRKFMDFYTAKKAIDQFLSLLRANGKRVAYLNFGGGEPLLNWKLIQKVLSYCNDVYAGEFDFSFTINTNGSLITPKIAESLKFFGVKIAISLDGLQEANDNVRVLKSGKGTFLKILKAIDILDGIDYSIGGFSTTVTERNFDHTNETLVDFSVDRGFVDVRVDLDVIHMLSIPMEVVIDKLMRIKRYGKSKGILVTGFWERPVENLNNSILDKYIGFCGGTVGRSLCINPIGDIFICGYSATKTGNIFNGSNIAKSKKYKEIITGRMVGQIKRCIGCSIEGQCIGGCYITEEFGNLHAKTAIDYNCQLYQRMTVELLKDALEEAKAS